MSIRTTSHQRERRVIVFSFDGEAPELWELVRDLTERDVEFVVVDLAVGVDLHARYPGLDARHASDYRLEPEVRDARELAAEWMHSLPFRTRLAGPEPNLLEAFTDCGSPTWWQLEISLHETSFFGVQLIETARAAIRVEAPSHYAIVGEPPSAAWSWKVSVLRQACRGAGLLEHALPAAPQVAAASERPERPSGLTRAIAAARTPVSSYPSGGRPRTIDAFGEGSDVRMLIRVGAAIAAVPTAIALMASVIGLPALRLVSMLRRRPGPGQAAVRDTLARVLTPVGARALRARLAQLLRGGRRAAGAGVVLALQLSVPLAVAAIVILLVLHPGALPVVGVGVGALALGYAVAVLFAPTTLSFAEMVLWPATQIEQGARSTRHWVATVPRRRLWLARTRLAATARRLRPGRAAGGGPAPLRVMFLIEDADMRARYSITRRKRSWYIAYLEGVIDAFDRRRDTEVYVLSVGDGPRLFGLEARRRQRQMAAEGRWLRYHELIGPEMLEASTAREPERRAAWEQLAADPGFVGAFSYRGVSLWEALAGLLGEIFLGTHAAPIYHGAFERALRQVRPDLLVTYNFEGYFRRWMPVPVKLGVPTLGVQQALGPYLHAHDHRLAGYSTPSAPRDLGVAVPDRVAVWGQRDVTYFTEYGHRRGYAIETGYPRTDTYVRERGRVARQGVRRWLEVPRGAPVIAYTSVLSVLQTGLMQEHMWLQTFRDLVALADERGAYVLVKPWGGDDLAAIRDAVECFGSDRVRYIEPRIDVHNAELLAVVDVLVGTFSSIFAEAVIMDVVPVLLDYPMAAYYFGPEVARYEEMALRAQAPDEVPELVRRALDASARTRRQLRTRALRAMRPLFGPLDGQAADRIAQAGIELARAGRFAAPSDIASDGHPSADPAAEETLAAQEGGAL